MFLCACIVAPIVNATAPRGTPHQIDCPAEIPQESLPLARAPAGWTSSVRSSVALHAIDLSDGPPSAMTFLKPDYATSHGNNIYTEKWIDLSPERAPDGTWIACSYGDSNNVILGKRLDDKVSECIAKYTKNKYGSNNIEVSCTW